MITPGSERRAHFRLPLRVTASLKRGDPTFETIAATTQDISSGGCYCISPKGLVDGEFLECMVVIAHSRLQVYPALQPGKDLLPALVAMRRGCA